MQWGKVAQKQQDHLLKPQPIGLNQPHWYFMLDRAILTTLPCQVGFIHSFYKRSLFCFVSDLFILILVILYLVSGMSPPTRDIDPDPHLAPPNPQDQRSLQEIKHLRVEINKCLDQILKVEETAQNGTRVLFDEVKIIRIVLPNIFITV